MGEDHPRQGHLHSMRAKNGMLVGHPFPGAGEGGGVFLRISYQQPKHFIGFPSNQ
jgi:hypothetical protein